MLLQVLVKAPGNPNRTTFLPLKMSLVVFHTGPSVVIIRNLVSGSRSPTLMVIRILPDVIQPSFSDLFCSSAFRHCGDLDGPIVRNGRQSQPCAFLASPGRYPVEFEREPLQAGRRAGDRQG